MRVYAPVRSLWIDERSAANIRVVRESLDAEARALDSRLLARISEIEARSFPEGAWSVHTFAAHLGQPNAQLFTARDARNEVAGFVLTSRGGDGSTVTIVDVAVDPNHRKKGIGERLMIGAMQHARTSGARRARLHVEASNVGAQRLYERLGFESISRCPSFYGSGKDGVLMEADL